MSEAQTIANRLNAKRSTGPKTPEGKFRVSKNAEKHGILSKSILVNGESEEEWREFHDGSIRYFNPVGPFEIAAAEKLVSLTWRDRRVLRFEAASASQTKLAATEHTARPPQRELIRRTAKLTPPQSGPCDPLEIAERNEAVKLIEEFMQPPLQDLERKVTHRVVLRIMTACQKVLDAQGLWMIPDPRNPEFMGWCAEKPDGDITTRDWTVGLLHKVVVQHSKTACWPHDTILPFIIENMKQEEQSYDPISEARQAEMAAEIQAEHDLKALPHGEALEIVLRYNGSIARDLKQARAALRELQLDRKAGRFDDDDDLSEGRAGCIPSVPPTPPQSPSGPPQSEPRPSGSGQPVQDCSVRPSGNGQPVQDRFLTGAVLTGQPNVPPTTKQSQSPGGPPQSEPRPSGSGQPVQDCSVRPSGSGQPEQDRSVRPSGSGQPVQDRSVRPSGSGQPVPARFLTGAVLTGQPNVPPTTKQSQSPSGPPPSEPRPSRSGQPVQDRFLTGAVLTGQPNVPPTTKQSQSPGGPPPSEPRPSGSGQPVQDRSVRPSGSGQPVQDRVK